MRAIVRGVNEVNSFFNSISRGPFGERGSVEGSFGVQPMTIELIVSDGFWQFFLSIPKRRGPIIRFLNQD